MSIRFIEIAIFFLVFNLVIQLINSLNLVESPTPLLNPVECDPSQQECWNEEQIRSGYEKIHSTAGEKQNLVTGTLNWLIENVRLAVQGISAFIKMFLGATIFVHSSYVNLLCREGVDCNFGSSMMIFITILDVLTYLVYGLALAQLASGRSMKEGY